MIGFADFQIIELIQAVEHHILVVFVLYSLCFQLWRNPQSLHSFVRQYHEITRVQAKTLDELLPEMKCLSPQYDLVAAFIDVYHHYGVNVLFTRFE
jgi:hypothetical protein